MAEHEIVYCPICGHSASLGKNGKRLSEGSDDCGRTLRVIDYSTWEKHAPNLKLTLDGSDLLEETRARKRGGATDVSDRGEH